MRKCCVCGKEAPYTANGLHWCREHYQATKGKPKKLTPLKRKIRHIELGIDWL